MIVALCGGVGAARFLAGLVEVVDPSKVTAIVNTGDDLTYCGLAISPDLDTILYTLGHESNTASGWGRRNESWRVIDELSRLGGPDWFSVGDLDLATHLYRRHRLDQGASLSSITDELAARFDVAIRLLPMSEDTIATRVTLAEPALTHRAGSEVAFQDYFVRMRHDVSVKAIRFEGAESARPTPGVLDAISLADAIIIAPSNPIVSIGPILAIESIAHALHDARSKVIAISPLIAGRALKGPADRLLRDLGPAPGLSGVAQRYSPFAKTLVIDRSDARSADVVADAGMECILADTLMSDTDAAARLAQAVLDAV